MSTLSTFLWFEQGAFDAARYYVSVFPNSRITTEGVLDPQGHGPVDEVPVVSFELDGMPFTAISGGPVFTMTGAVSFVIACADQAEVDHYWERLGEGGAYRQCGWLTDRFGVTWQVVPTRLHELMSDPDPVRAQAVQTAMLSMGKLVIADLEAAADHA
jgi:predicted 3-demethylubiquinone-9 3-methyltransferase (glyoxalase superfamily)